jgi:outer membrane protein assembly factor BamD
MMRANIVIRTRTPALLLAISLLLGACSTRVQNPGTLAPDDLFTLATDAVETRRFDRAITLLEHFVTQHLGDPRAPTARLMLAEAHMSRREYATAATHFQQFVLSFPNNPRGLEARFRICEAYGLLSPRPALDQQYTLSALDHCASVATGFPGTPEATSAAELAAELRLKLAQKAYDTGMQYFRRRAFDAAVVYFQDVVRNYPDTDLAPAALSQLVETYTRMGYVEDAQETRDRLLREYPGSEEAQSLRV